MVRWASVPLCPECDAIMGFEESDETWECTECDTIIDDNEFDED